MITPGYHDETYDHARSERMSERRQIERDEQRCDHCKRFLDDGEHYGCR